MTDTAKKLDDQALDILWRTARTYNSWQEKDVPETLLRELYDLWKMGATAANSCPARVVFVKSPEAKARLKPFLDGGNVDKTMAAPVTAIIGYDLKFYDQLPVLFPHVDARSWYAHDEKVAEKVAFQGASLQGAYLMLAARSLGLDCGPMGGFKRDGVRKEFFEGTDIVPNFLCNLGYGAPEGLYPRAPRLDFDTVCKVL